MQYLVDGYNLLFFLSGPIKDIRKKREALLSALEDLLSNISVPTTVIFEGKHQADEESGRVQFPHFLVIFAPKGKSADDYILEFLSYTFYPAEFTVVSSDLKLCSQARNLGAQTKDLSEFLSFLERKEEKAQKMKEEKLTKETKKNFERLLKIFEKRFQEGDGS